MTCEHGDPSHESVTVELTGTMHQATEHVSYETVVFNNKLTLDYYNILIQIFLNFF